jgi:hypothetical protein
VPASVYAKDESEFAGNLATFDVIIMTQSCDIENGKVRSLLLCPVFDLWTFIDAAKSRGENWGSDIREDLRQGNLPGYHLLSDAFQDELQFPLTIVDFHEVYTAPTVQVRQFAAGCGNRLRLRPPYREHLGQAFARFFMRVGLPVGIPKERLKTRPK